MKSQYVIAVYRVLWCSLSCAWLLLNNRINSISLPRLRLSLLHSIKRVGRETTQMKMIKLFIFFMFGQQQQPKTKKKTVLFVHFILKLFPHSVLFVVMSSAQFGAVTKSLHMCFARWFHEFIPKTISSNEDEAATKHTKGTNDLRRILIALQHSTRYEKWNGTCTHKNYTRDRRLVSRLQVSFVHILFQRRRKWKQQQTKTTKLCAHIHTINYQWLFPSTRFQFMKMWKNMHKLCTASTFLKVVCSMAGEFDSVENVRPLLQMRGRVTLHRWTSLFSRFLFFTICIGQKFWLKTILIREKNKDIVFCICHPTKKPGILVAFKWRAHISSNMGWL